MHTSYCNCHGEDERCCPYSQKTATTPAAEMDEAGKKDFEGVVDVEEQSDEDEEYDTETEFLTK